MTDPASLHAQHPAAPAPCGPRECACHQNATRWVFAG
jgi:hypothetical protein